MRRWHDEEALARREQRKHLRRVHGWPRKPVDCACDWQVGRFRKKDAFDCGRARCHLCHGDKLLGLPRRIDLLAKLRLREGVAEINGR